MQKSAHKFYHLVHFFYAIKQEYKKRIIIFLVFCVISNIQINYLNRRYEEVYNNDKEKVFLTGIVISNPEEKDYTIGYQVKILDKKYKNTNLIIYVKKGKEELSFGDKIFLEGEYKKPSSRRNYKGFDYSKYLKNKNIYGTVMVEKATIIDKNKGNLFFTIANQIRQSMKEKIEHILNPKTKGLLLGLLLGDTTNIEEEIKEDFRLSSLSHMLAVSGMHVSYITLGIIYCLEKSNMHKKLIYSIVSFVLIIFIFITGFTASMIRACVMGGMILFSKICYRRFDIQTGISFSLLITLICNPFKIADVGLLLSYGGVIGIIIFHRKIQIILDGAIQKENRFLRFIKETIAISIAVQIIIFPIMISYFNTVNFTFLLSNFFAIPLLAIIIILGFIVIFLSYLFFPIAKALSFSLNTFLELLISVSKWSSKFTFLNFYVITPNIIEIVAYYLFFIFIIKNKSRYAKICFVFLLIYILILPNIIQSISNDLKIYFIDVSQGDSTLIDTPQHKKILIDGGGNIDLNGFDVGQKTLLPYLLNRRIKTLDYVIISHFDSDHCNGLIAILENLTVDTVIFSKQTETSSEYEIIIEIIKRKNIKVKLVQSGDRIILDKYTYLDILYPDFKLSEKDLNNNSIVAKLNYGNFSMLFTGDIEKEAEQYLVGAESISAQLESTILKIPHHGSKTSSTDGLLKMVNPKIVLIGVGENNTFGHPNSGVLERLENLRNTNL